MTEPDARNQRRVSVWKIDFALNALGNMPPDDLFNLGKLLSEQRPMSAGILARGLGSGAPVGRDIANQPPPVPSPGTVPQMGQRPQQAPQQLSPRQQQEELRRQAQIKAQQGG